VSASLIGYAFWNQRIATAKEFQTKVDYIFLFGSLIDDVVAGKKDQQVALLDALSSFRNNLVSDLATNPDSAQLQHLLSLIYHYETIVYQRAESFTQAVESRIESVALLKGLRIRYPENSKYRFQYIYGVVMLYVTVESANWNLPEQFLFMQRKLGVANHHELVKDIWPEIEAFKHEFSRDKDQINACTQFKNDLAQLLYVSDPETLDRVKEEVIAESILLADQSPETPEYIKPALTAVQQRLSQSLTLGDYQNAIQYMKRADELFDKYLRKSFDTLWVKVYYLEMKTWHAYCLFLVRRFEHVEEVCLECLPHSEELSKLSEYRLMSVTCGLKLQTMLLLCSDSVNEDRRSIDRLKQILFALESPETPTTALATYATWVKAIKVPDEVSKTLENQLALRSGTN
jgi:hypothetical protein